MRAVNLLPRENLVQKRERPNPVALVAGIGGAVVLLVLVAGFLLANRSVDRQRQALNSAKAELAATPAKKQVSSQTNTFRSAVLSQRESRSLALAAAIGKRVAWDRILRRMALVLPDDVWLTSLAGVVPLDSADAAAVAGATTTTSSAIPATATELSLGGSTYSQASVARLLARLQVVPDLKNVQLQSSATASIGGVNVVNFTIVMDIRQGRGAS
jgi:Tfp pilus assembly protein PilN